MKKTSNKNNPKARILSFHHIPNNGAFLFSYALENLLREIYPKANVESTDYREPHLALYESLKRFKLMPNTPFFYLQRSLIWNKELNRHLSLDKKLPRFQSTKNIQRFFSDKYKLLVVGMDVWSVAETNTRPPFPNIFWLPQKMSAAKIAYAVSAYYSDQKLIRTSREKLTTYLNDFKIVGTRDEFTHRFVLEHRDNPDGIVEQIPDPTFYFPIKKTKIKEKLQALGIDPGRPILAILLYGQEALTYEIRNHYHKKGYQIIALSMYSGFADINLGHLLTPFEWAEIFQYVDFCITDRFHGTIFCLKNQTPFLSLEKDTHLPREQSKIYDLLRKFNMEACYQTPVAPNFSPKSLLARADQIEAAWKEDFAPNIPPKLDKFKKELESFNQKLKESFPHLAS